MTHYKLCYFVRSTDRQKTGTVALNNANVNTDVCKSSFDCCSNFRRLIPMTSQWATSQTESNDRLASASFEVNRYYDISNEERTSSKLERNSTSVTARAFIDHYESYKSDSTQGSLQEKSSDCLNCEGLRFTYLSFVDVCCTESKCLYASILIAWQVARPKAIKRHVIIKP